MSRCVSQSFSLILHTFYREYILINQVLLISKPGIPDCLGHTIQICEVRKQQLRAKRIQRMPLDCFVFSEGDKEMEGRGGKNIS